jgi:hypothetical protein
MTPTPLPGLYRRLAIPDRIGCGAATLHVVASIVWHFIYQVKPCSNTYATALDLCSPFAFNFFLQAHKEEIVGFL